MSRLRAARDADGFIARPDPERSNHLESAAHCPGQVVATLVTHNGQRREQRAGGGQYGLPSDVRGAFTREEVGDTDHVGAWCRHCAADNLLPTTSFEKASRQFVEKLGSEDSMDVSSGERPLAQRLRIVDHVTMKTRWGRRGPVRRTVDPLGVEKHVEPD